MKRLAYYLCFICLLFSFLLSVFSVYKSIDCSEELMHPLAGVHLQESRINRLCNIESQNPVQGNHLLKLGTNAPYLFTNDHHFLFPQELITYSDFARAIEALLPSDTGFELSLLRQSEDAATGSYIHQILALFYPESQLKEVNTGEEGITRTQFAVLMNQMLERDKKHIVLNEESQQPSDVLAVDPYLEDLLEASVIHEKSPEGKSWTACSSYLWERTNRYLSMHYVDATQEGTVEIDYGSNNTLILTYLPYDYDPQKQYNVLVYQNGDDLSPYGILGEDTSYCHNNHILGVKLSTRNFIDSLIQYGYCEPLIIVSTYTTTRSDRVDRYLEILQHTVDHYSTYAESSDLESLIAARSHFALAGNSTGSQSVCIAMQELPDVFGSYGLFSGITKLEDTVAALGSKSTLDHVILTSGNWTDPNFDMTIDAFRAFEHLSNINDLNYILYAKQDHGFELFDGGIMELLSAFSPATDC